VRGLSKKVGARLETGVLKALRVSGFSLKGSKVLGSGVQGFWPLIAGIFLLTALFGLSTSHLTCFSFYLTSEPLNAEPLNQA
jgi:hypothetical protein